jgi:hypothetical protein
MDIRNPCTKVKYMKIRFFTLVEKKVTTSFKTLLHYFMTIQFMGQLL